MMDMISMGSMRMGEGAHCGRGEEDRDVSGVEGAGVLEVEVEVGEMDCGDVQMLMVGRDGLGVGVSTGE